MEDDYIPALEAAEVLQMSPGRFADLLRKERDRLPVEIDYDGELLDNPFAMFAPRALERFYAGELADPAGFLWCLKIHRLDFETYQTAGGHISTNKTCDNMKTKEKKSYLTIIAALYAHIKKQSSASPCANAIASRGAAGDIVAKVEQVVVENQDSRLSISENTVKKIIAEIEEIILK